MARITHGCFGGRDARDCTIFAVGLIYHRSALVTQLLLIFTAFFRCIEIRFHR